jgi:LuxR family transcriptional regulator, maltose regulon positive regulatory protein
VGTTASASKRRGRPNVAERGKIRSPRRPPPDAGESAPAIATGGPGSSTTSFRAKFEVPVLPATWTPRDRLDRLVTSAVAHRLTVVTGPPGSGKTVLLSAWSHRHSDRRVAWVSLEGTDDDPRRFWLMITEALHCFGPRSAAPSVSDTSRDRKSRAGVGAVIETTRGLPQIVLILDDFHVIGHPTIVKDVAHLVRSVPKHISIVLSGRDDPTFPLHQVRVQGHLAEIREQDLRFDIPEAAELVEAVAGTGLAADDLEMLVGRTEGWAVGVQLAALSLREEKDPSEFVRRFAGSTHLVVEYLIGEVLDQLPEKLVRFLLLTSVLNKMSGPLCNAVTGESDSTSILDELVARHLFVIRMDAEHRWYRYHQLFADMLKHTLHVRDPKELVLAHARAADWLENDGDIQEAVAHLVAAGAFDEAFSLTARSFADQVEVGVAPGRFVPTDRIPDTYYLEDPVRMYERAAALLVGLHEREGVLWLHRLQRKIRGNPDLGWLKARIELLWTVRDWLEGNPEGIVLHQRRVARLAGPEGELPPIPEGVQAIHPWLERLDHSVESVMVCLMARAFNWLGDPEAARGALSLDGDALEPSLESVAVPGVLAVAAANLGNLAEGHALATSSLEMAAQTGLEGGSAGTIDAHTALGSIHLERNELADSENHLLLALLACQKVQAYSWTASVEVQLASLHLARGHTEDAETLMSRLRDNEALGVLPRHVRMQLDLADVKWRLIAGDFEGAFSRIGQVDEIHRPLSLEAWIDLCAGRPDDAVNRITGAPHPAASLREELDRLVILAHGSLDVGLPRRARNALALALQKARPQRYVRLFLDHGEAIGELLQTFKSRFSDPYLEHLLQQAYLSGDAEPVEEFGALIEGLTPRERAALTLLSTHLTQQQIASELFVSLNTLKTHLKGLYRKLGATSRAEAVTLARRYGLI